MAGSITWNSLWNLMHIILCVTCQCRHSRNVLTKALRNIHCHCSTGFMKSGVLHLRHSLQKTILIKVWRNLNNFTLCWLHLCWRLMSSSFSADLTWQQHFAKTWSADLRLHPYSSSLSVTGEIPSSILLYTKRDLVFRFFSSVLYLQHLHFPILCQGILTDVHPINCYKV